MNQDSWFRDRRYLHFDPPISFEKAKNIVENPQEVVRHAFYPFICMQKKSERVSIDRTVTPKKISRKKKIREICYASHIDSHIYAYYGEILSSKYEKLLQELGLGKCVLAFRSLGESNIEFAKKAFEEIKRRKQCSVLTLDIEKFFDKLDHKLLKKAWKDILQVPGLPLDHYKVYKSITEFSKLEKELVYNLLGIPLYNPYSVHVCQDSRRLCLPSDFRKKIKRSQRLVVNKKNYGIPQGAAISAVLSNIYMLSFDKYINSYCNENNIVYFRYCDDMIFITPPGCTNEIKKNAELKINELCLSLQVEKTEIFDIDCALKAPTGNKPLQYLGFHFYGNKVLIRSSSMARFHQRMRKALYKTKKKAHTQNQIRLSKGITQKEVYKKKIYHRFSYIGKNNFLRYAFRASAVHRSSSIKKQVKPLWKKLKTKI